MLVDFLILRLSVDVLAEHSAGRVLFQPILLYSLLSASIVFVLEALQNNRSITAVKQWCRLLIYYIAVLSIILLGAWGSSQFIYFQF